MRKAFSFLFLLIFIITFNIQTLSADKLRIATYNLWNPLFEAKYSAKDTWNERLPFIINNILSSESDVVCLQEVGKKNFLDLIQNLDIQTRYLSFYVPHAASSSGQQDGRDGVALLYNAEKVTLMKLVQSLKEFRPTHRRDFFVDLLFNDEKKTIKLRIACTHLDSEMNPAIGNTQLSALVNDLLKMDTSHDIDLIVVCGDFNEGEEESPRPRHEIMQKAGFFNDGSTETTRPEALNVRHKGHVDWIYFKRFSTLDFSLIAHPPIGDEKASDHKLTMTDIKIE